MHILINGLSMGTGGGYTVGRELLRSLAMARPSWTFTMAVIAGKTLHENLREECFPPNCRLLWAPPGVAGRVRRTVWERHDLTAWARANDVRAVVQLNGLIVPGIGVPTLSHNQDPWPYRSEAWTTLKERLLAFLKRRAHLRALRSAAAVGWTSHYLQDLVCGFHKVRPRISEVFYNGLPSDWLTRAEHLPDWSTRPMQIVTVSNVEPYKRQDLVIRAVAQLAHERDFSELRYHIVGQCSDAYRAELLTLAASLGIGEQVAVEGRVSDARVRELYESSRCFVLMSVCESFGIPAIEAMSLGTPVVTSRCCAMPEVCGPAADLVQPDQVDDLAAALRRVLLNAEHAAELRRLGAERVRQFDWRITADKMARLLENLGPEVTPGRSLEPKGD